MSTKIINREGIENSLQISKLGNISGTEFSLPNGEAFLVKNTSADVVTLKVQLSGMTEPIETSFYPGWNPELVTKIVEITDSISLQYGY